MYMYVASRAFITRLTGSMLTTRLPVVVRGGEGEQGVTAPIQAWLTRASKLESLEQPLAPTCDFLVVVKCA